VPEHPSRSAQASEARVFVDSDNALGARAGDIDDGIALAVLLSSGAPVEALASVFGNASAADAHLNNQRLAELCGFSGPCLAGAGAPDAPLSAAARALARSADRTILALGPLTNVAQALAEQSGFERSVRELICLGSNRVSRGRWPPVWPFEFNFTKDRDALCRVFESELPITIVPLDQAVRMRVRYSDLDAIGGVLGEYIRTHARRWFVRARWLKGQSTVPVWDLVAASYRLEPRLFDVRRVAARAHPSGWIEYDAGDRHVQVISDFDPAAVWRRALEILDAAGREPARLRESG